VPRLSHHSIHASGLAALGLVLTALAVVLQVSLLTQPAEPVGAASPGWVVQKAADPRGSPIVTLNAVSCAASDACTTVGSSETGANAAVTVAEGWDGSEWAAEATPDPVGADESSLTGVSCPSPSFCTAVGYQQTASGSRLPVAESWSNGVWTLQPVPSRPRANPSYLFAVSCASANACEGVGYDENGAGTARVVVDGWNGTRWTVQPAPGSAALGSLFGVSCPLRSDCIAVGVANSGAPLAERWNGSQWSLSSPARPAGLKNVTLGDVSCTSATQCMTIGFTVDKAETFATLSEIWNGRTWTIEPTPAPAGGTQAALDALSCASATSCLAVGNDYRTGLQSHDLAESWNGTTWSIVQSPGRGSINSVSCPSAGPCTVVASGPLAETWNGVTWTSDALPSLAGTSQSGLAGVSCRAGGRCTAVGSYWSDGSELALAERRSAGAWSIQPVHEPTGSRNTTLESVSCPSTSTCVAVGSYVVNNPFFKSFSEVWAGAGWVLVRLPSPEAGATEIDIGSVSCASQTSCVAVGSYQNASGIELTLVEGWNGSTWTVVPSPNPAGEEVSAFTSVSCPTTSSCTAVGYWASIQGIDLSLAATWDGSTWSIQPTPGSTGQTETRLVSVSCAASNSCTAVGESAGTPLAIGWDGSTWATENTESFGDAGSLASVSCSAASACTATGSASSQPLAAVWDGGSWTLETTPTLSGGGTFNAVSCPTTTRCNAVGSGTDDAGTPQVLAERRGLTGRTGNREGS
jgi:hypothetical protein